MEQTLNLINPGDIAGFWIMSSIGSNQNRHFQAQLIGQKIGGIVTIPINYRKMVKTQFALYGVSSKS